MHGFPTNPKGRLEAGTNARTGCWASWAKLVNDGQGMAETAERGDLYKEKAAMLRDLARQTRFPECRSELLALAERFEKLAVWVEMKESAAD